MQIRDPDELANLGLGLTSFGRINPASGPNDAQRRLRENVAKIYEFLRMVRVAGGWRSYVTEQRRTLATLRELWKRKRRLAATSSSLTQGAGSDSPRGDSSAPSHEGASGDVAVWSRVFELPVDLAGRVLGFYTDLVL